MAAGAGGHAGRTGQRTVSSGRLHHPEPARVGRTAGHAFSVHGLTGNLGWALAPAFLVGITAMADWRTAYHAAAVLYLVVLGVLFWQRERLRTQVAQRHADATTRSDLAFLKLPVVWWCFAFFLLSTMTLAVVQSFGPSILKAVHGVGMEAATLTFSAYMVCGAFGMLVGGFVATWGQRRHWSQRSCGRLVHDRGRPDAAGLCHRYARRHGHHGGAGPDRFCCRRGWAQPRHDDQEGHAQGRHRPGVRHGLFRPGHRICHFSPVLRCADGPWAGTPPRWRAPVWCCWSRSTRPWVSGRAPRPIDFSYSDC
jgi:hypothetical protein